MSGRRRPYRDRGRGGNWGANVRSIDIETINGTPELLGIFSTRDFMARDFDELRSLAERLGVEENGDPEPIDKRSLVDLIIAKSDESLANSLVHGVLEITPEGFGVLRGNQRWLPDPADIYVSQAQIRRTGMRTGDFVTGQVRRPKDNEKYRGLVRVVAINNADPKQAPRRPRFRNLVPIFPTDQILLEHERADLTTRVIDLVAPIGRGQRGLIVSPPKAGKTEVMKRIAKSVSANYDDLQLLVALIGERPEEVTDWQRNVKAEVISSTFDEHPDSHCRVAELTMQRARRLVENGANVVLFLDSITRLARAYNLQVPSSGKTLSGGVDPAALVPPKTFFGSGRNIENGGSLTVLASCLIDTGSRMDEVIYEEFKGTGNWELILNRRLAERGTFPSVDVIKSGTRRIELLLDDEKTRMSWLLRRMLIAVGDEDAIELMLDQLKKTRDNADFMSTIQKQSL